MGKSFKFGRITEKLSEYEQIIVIKVTNLATFVSSLKNNHISEREYKILEQYSNFRQELRWDAINLKIIKILKKGLLKSCQKIDQIFIQKYYIPESVARENIYLLYREAKTRLAEEEIKEKQIKNLIMVSKNFLYYDGSDLFFCGGGFGEYIVASMILDELNVTQRIKDRFYLEIDCQNFSPEPDETPDKKFDKEKISERGDG